MMSKLYAGFLVAVTMLGPAASRAAVFEIPTPRSFSAPVLNVQGTAATLLPAVVERFDGRSLARRLPGPSQGGAGVGPDGKLMRIADSGSLPGNLAVAATGSDFIAKTDLAGLPKPNSSQDALQPPEVGTLLLLGAGLIAYQLRRQARRSRDFIKVPS